MKTITYLLLACGLKFQPYMYQSQLINQFQHAIIIRLTLSLFSINNIVLQYITVVFAFCGIDSFSECTDIGAPVTRNFPVNQFDERMSNVKIAL